MRERERERERDDYRAVGQEVILQTDVAESRRDEQQYVVLP